MTSISPPRACPQCGTVSPSEHSYCPACGFPIGNLSNGKGNEDRFVGQTLPGGYHILDLISVGGMGRVYRAEQSVLGRTVAVKIIHPHLLADENAALRFLTEARAASQLNHPNSIAVFDFGRTDDGQPYLVMEFLRGRDLAHVCFEQGNLPFYRIIDVLCQVLSALSEAHALGIVHRDLKPENVILEPMRRGGDFVKVLDFGLAKLKADAQAPRNVTSPGIVCGTPDYMAPEQGRGDAIDGRSDLYAVGIMLFQLLTGRLPFEADSPTQVVMMHLTVPVPDPRELAPERGIPDSLAEIVFKALRKNPQDRYQEAEEFADALKSAMHTSAAAPSTSRRSLMPAPSVRPQTTIACPGCGLIVPAGRYCLECATRLPTLSSPPVRPSQVQLPLVLLEREQDWQWLIMRGEAGKRELAAGRVVGEQGIGKTRLLHDFLRHQENAGALVAITGPDPYLAEVPCHALRDTIEQLVVVDTDELAQGPRDGLEESTRLGLLEVLGGTLPLDDQRDPLELRRARADALRWALNEACVQFSPNLIVLAIDDLQRVDTPSRDAFADLVGDRFEHPVLVLAAHSSAFEPGWSARHPARVLNLLSRVIAERILQSGRVDIPGGALPEGGVTPLLIDQVLRFNSEGGSAPVARLADLVGQRLDILPPDARRALQALAILGDRSTAELLSELMHKSDDIHAALKTLESRGMVWLAGPHVSMDHPLLRDLVIAAIPVAARRELYTRSVRLWDRRGAPLEARAQLAYLAEDSFQALFLLEQSAERASVRGDASSEILSLRRGLELARREISRGELDDPLRAVVIFSRKLGAALTRAGNYSDAEGILREALDYAGPSGGERARLLGALAHVSRGRDRINEALAYLDQALDAARQSGSHDLVQAFSTIRGSWAGERLPIGHS